MEWYYADRNGQQQSVDETQLLKLAADGVITPTTLLWNASLPDWKSASELRPELFSGAVPPHVLSPGQPPGAPVYGGGPVGFPVAKAPTNALAVVSLVLGIISVVSCGYGGFLGIGAVICGHIARKSIREETLPSSNGGLALGGLITGYIGLALFLVIIVIYVLMFGAIAVGAATGVEGSEGGFQGLIEEAQKTAEEAVPQ